MADVAAVANGFPPVAGIDARILVLGSLPGRRSITDQQYYAHPQNAFWPIMREVFRINGSYVERCEQLIKNRIALWDVLANSVRPGSMDADIRLDSAKANDFGAFLGAYPDIRCIAFNGKKASQLFEKLVDNRSAAAAPSRIVLPSTSPAFAAMRFSSKLALWREALVLNAAA